MANTVFFPVQLQLFAEDAQGAGVMASDAGVQSGEHGAPDAGVQDRSARFEALIKGEFKDLYDARVRDTIQKRLKSQKETLDKYHALTPTLQLLAGRYGIADPSDVDSLNKAIEQDDIFLQEEAARRDMSVEQLRQFRQIQKENEQLKGQQEARQRRERISRRCAQWASQEQALRQVYPSFDLRAEVKDPQFRALLGNGVDLRTAYEVVHRDDILSGAMHYAAETVQRKLAGKLASNGARPLENGMNAQGAAVIKNDVTQMTRKDRDAIRRRVASGEKIRF